MIPNLRETLYSPFLDLAEAPHGFPTLIFTTGVLLTIATKRQAVPFVLRNPIISNSEAIRITLFLSNIILLSFHTKSVLLFYTYTIAHCPMLSNYFFTFLCLFYAPRSEERRV